MRDFIIDALAAHRITRLVTADDLTRPLREKVIKFAYGDTIRQKSARVLGSRDAYLQFDGLTELATNDETVPNLAKLVLCPYCVSVYAGFGVAFARKTMPGVWDPIARALAAAAVVSLIPPGE